MLITWILFTAVGVYIFIKRYAMYRKIDSCAIAEVTDITKLGVDEYGRMYAIKYKVFADEELEMYQTPCHKKMKIGTQKVLYYQSDDLQKNHYFKTIKTWDRRLNMPLLMLVFGIILMAAELFKIF